MKVSDIPHVQQANITNLPENYFCKYYMYHALTWPQLSYVAVDVSSCSLLSHHCSRYNRHGILNFDGKSHKVT